MTKAISKQPARLDAKATDRQGPPSRGFAAIPIHAACRLFLPGNSMKLPQCCGEMRIAGRGVGDRERSASRIDFRQDSEAGTANQDDGWRGKSATVDTTAGRGLNDHNFVRGPRSRSHVPSFPFGTDIV